MFDYLKYNRDTWNKKTAVHLDSEFYDMKAFMSGRTSLNAIELDLLGDVKGKSILHLQCHFGQDSLSLARMGASVTGIDLSNTAIKQAKELSNKLEMDANFICCDIYDTPNEIKEQFDIVFASYGTIGWLPDMKRWAEVVNKMLLPGGKFVFVEFHPAVWMFDDDFKTIGYDYFNTGEIVESYSGSYADRNADIETTSVMWNHSLADVLQNLIDQGLEIKNFQEYDYSPYNCLRNMQETEPGKWVIEHFSKKFPMVYSVVATKR